MQFRHAVGARPLKAHDRHAIAKQFAGLERGVQFLLAVEDPRRRFDHMALGRDGRGLDDGAAERPVEHAQAAGILERMFCAAQHGFVMAS